MLRTDPRSVRPANSVRPTDTVRPRRRARRNGRAWPALALALGTALLALGVVVGHGLLLAAGLVLVGAAGHLLDA